MIYSARLGRTFSSQIETAAQVRHGDGKDGACPTSCCQGIGDRTATGQLQATLFSEWPETHLACLSSAGSQASPTVRFSSAGFDTTSDSVNEVLSLTVWFNPDVVLYRPVPGATALHTALKAILTNTGVPLVLWIVDDWMSVHRFQKSREFENLPYLMERAQERLVISEDMAIAYSMRFQKSFVVVHNGVLPSDIPKEHSAHQSMDPFQLGYRGSVSDLKELRSLQLVARSVGGFNAQQRGVQHAKLRFSVSTLPKQSLNAAKLGTFPHVTLEEYVDDPSAYRASLTKCDSLLLAYAFERKSRRYLRYSMPNKLPEYLASGSPILYVGPRDLPVSKLLKTACAGHVVNARSHRLVISALRRLVSDDNYRRELVNSALSLAKSHFDLNTQRAVFYMSLSRAAGR